MVSYGAPSNEEKWHPLDCFFAPQSVAVIGASERPGSVGRTIFWNLLSSPFGGTVYAVNPHHARVLGIRTLNSVKDAPEPVDLALIITPAATVPSMLDACIEAGVQGAIIFSADYSDEGAPSETLSEAVRQRTRTGKIRIIGPNSLGLMNPILGLNAAYASSIAMKGTVGFISQSGALCASILDWSLKVKMGFSAFVSFGQMVDVGWSELIYYLGSDPQTKSIVIYMESLGNARAFISAAREVALSKPIIILKMGRTRTALSGEPLSTYFETPDTVNDELLSAALVRSGVLRVSSVDTLFSMAEALGKQPRPKGPRLTIISNAAGPGVLAADALVSEGGELAELSADTREELRVLMPPRMEPANPIDLLPDAGPDRYARAVSAALKDENSDGVLVLLAPQVATRPTATAECIAALDHFGQKPVLASWMGGDLVEEGTALLNEHLIPTFPYPDQAAGIFASMWRYSYAVRGLYETPESQYGNEISGGKREGVSRMLADLRESGEVRLSDAQTKQILAVYGIPVTTTYEAFTEDEAVDMALRLGYPVFIEPGLRERSRHSRPEYHILINEEEVRQRFRVLAGRFADQPGKGFSIFSLAGMKGHALLLSAKVDEQFGPYIIFGSGGPFVDVLRDVAYALPPLNTTLARRAMERTRIYAALKEQHRGVGVNLGQLEQVLIGFSNLILNERWIRSIEINPLMASENGLLALNAQAVLHDPAVTVDQLPQPAIRPYPVEYCTTAALSDGTPFVMRPIRPEDETFMVKFHETLSSETVYFHYLQLLSLDQRIRHDRISQMCFIDYDRQIGLVAEYMDPATGERAILALARLIRIHGTQAGDFALVVNDRFQGRGLGRKLLKYLLEVAAAEKISPVVGIIHPENHAMLGLCRKLGFQLSKPVGEAVRAEYSTDGSDLE